MLGVQGKRIKMEGKGTMKYKGEVIITYARPYEMNEGRNKGITLQYYPDDNIQPFAENNAFGRKVIDETLPFELFEKLKDVPALYEITVEMRTVTQKTEFGSKDISVNKITDIKYLRDCVLEKEKPAVK